MGDVLAMLNHLLTAWLADSASMGAGAGEGWQFTDVRLDAQGGTIRARLGIGGFEGEIVIRLDADSPREGRQTLHLRVDQWPAQMPGALVPFRAVLEKARLHLELDFTP